jgi:TolB protein
MTGHQTQPAIYAVQADGSGLRLITQGAGQALYPSWSRDGSRVALASSVGGGSQLWVMNADGSDAHLASSAFPTCGYSWTSLTWAPSGDRLAAECWGDVSIFDLRSGESYPLPGSSRPWASDPDWSPDGKRIAISRPDYGGVSVVNPDGTGLAPLLSNASDATWSPDGEKLAFAAIEVDHAYVMVANVDGSGRTKVTPDSIAYFEAPTWSPDGKWLAFHGMSALCSRAGTPSEYCYTHWSIYVVRADGSGLKRLTPDSLESSRPSW